VLPLSVVALRIVLPVKLGAIGIADIVVVRKNLDNDALVSIRISPAFLVKTGSASFFKNLE
jgi:hypothetical protein